MVAARGGRPHRRDAAVSADGEGDELGVGIVAREPHDGLFPVVAVAEAVRRRVLGHVPVDRISEKGVQPVAWKAQQEENSPGVHDGVVLLILGGTGVDLTRRVRAAAVGRARGVQPSTVKKGISLHEH